MAKGPKRRPLERLVDRITGARLCYGEPVQIGATAIVPVARVRVSGGFGYGSSGDADGGGGGGGHIDAKPLGYIELRSDGSRYHEIPDPERSQRMLRAGAAAAAALITAAAGARRLRNGPRRSAGILSR